MNRIASSLALLVMIASAVACSSSSTSTDEEDGLSSSEDELRNKNKNKNNRPGPGATSNNIECRSQRLTNENCLANGAAHWGNDGYIYVNPGVCMQDDDDKAWVQCAGEEGGGDWNGGPIGDWYGFDTEGQPMRGACTAWIALGTCSDGPAPQPGSSSGNSGNASSTGPNAGKGKCFSQSHGAVDAYQCFQEADWRWYQCQKDGVILGAYGPNEGPLGPCQGEILWQK